MLTEQGGGCAICSTAPADGKKLWIDHDHSDGRVRGLLCASCNVGLGLFKENPALLTNAVAYLQ